MTVYGLPKANKLRSKKDIETLVSSGNSIIVGAIRIVWQVYPRSESESKIAVSVSKKRHKKAVTRNLLKRRIREAFRLSFPEFSEQLNARNISIHILFIYLKEDVLPYAVIETHIKNGLQKICSA